MDVDVITIETSRFDMELLRGFGDFSYPNEIGPGVYDMHRPRVPSVAEMTCLLEKNRRMIPADHLWVNPTAGSKRATGPKPRLPYPTGKGSCDPATGIRVPPKRASPPPERSGQRGTTRLLATWHEATRSNCGCARHSQFG